MWTVGDTYVIRLFTNEAAEADRTPMAWGVVAGESVTTTIHTMQRLSNAGAVRTSPVKLIDNGAFETGSVTFTVAGWRDYQFLQAVYSPSAAVHQLSGMVSTAALIDNRNLEVALQQNDELQFRSNLLTDTNPDDILMRAHAFTPGSGHTLTLWGILRT